MFGFETMTKRKGQIGGLTGAALSIVVLVSVLGFGALILTELDAQVTTQAGADSYAQNITESGLEGLGTFGEWVPIIVLVVLAAAVLYLLLTRVGPFAQG